LRIQINKKFLKNCEDIDGRTIRKKLDDLYSVIPKNNNGTFPLCVMLTRDYIPEHYLAYLGFFCKNCATESYCAWYEDKVWVDTPEYMFNHVDRSAFKSDQVYTNALDNLVKIKEYLYQLEKTSEDIKIGIEQEYHELCDNPICPVCGMPLSKEKGYFVINWNAADLSHDEYRDSYEKGIELDEDFCSYEVETEDVLNYDYDRLYIGYGKDGKRDFGHFQHFNVNKEIYHRLKNVESIFSRIKNDRLEIFNRTAKINVSKFIEKNNIIVPDIISSEIKDKIINNNKHLKKYIYALLKAETEIYALEKRLPELYSIIPEINILYNGEKYSSLYSLKKEYDEFIAEVQKIKNKKDNLKPKEAIVNLIIPVKPTPPVLKTPGLFFKNKTIAENEALTAQYNNSIIAYNNALSEYNTDKQRIEAIELEKYTSELEKYNLMQKNAEEKVLRSKSAYDNRIKADDFIPECHQLKQSIDNEIREAEELLKKLYKNRNELYSYNVIFEKYRNPVALASFYEYLMSGRCSSLEGHDGAYNIYENEIRMDIVISKLTDVIKSLNRIEKKQYMIYNEITNIHKSIDSLNKTMSSAVSSLNTIERNTAISAHNTAVSAYYSKLNAELTNALGFMLALN